MLMIALIASGMLVLHHFGSISMPGCGVRSACDLASKSTYGKLGAIPVSWLGFVHFLAMGIMWCSTRGAIGGLWRLVALLGAVASLFYTTIAIIHGFLCPYCFVAHGANFVFVALIGKSSPANSIGRKSLGAIAAAAIAFGGMIVVDLFEQSRASEESDQALKQTIDQLNATQTQSANIAPINPEVAVQPDNPLVGRYVIGPESAPVRIVSWLGYQCTDCQRIETELMSLVAANPGKINVTFRHFPLNTDCNPNAPGRHHGNACWAARAAESAGILGGSSAFEKMHQWLFDVKGDFSNAQLQQKVASMGFAPAAFERLMNDPTSLSPVTKDIDDAMRLGIFQTPFIFINGVELRGWNSAQALTRSVQTVLSTAPAVAKIGIDVAPDAAAKFVEDWRAMPILKVDPALLRNAQGPNDADVDVVVWGDFMEPGTAEVDGMFRLFATPQKPNIRYTFMQFPVNRNCNSSIQITKFENTCRAARVAKAAEILAGPDGYWKVHDRLFINKGELSDAMIEGIAMELGLNANDMWEAMALPDTQAMIDREAAAAMTLGLKSIPFVLVNGKQLTRFKAEHENIIPRIISAAAEERAANTGK
jgi:predicted DsbA family dithiol-disulfide isomerase